MLQSCKRMLFSLVMPPFIKCLPCDSQRPTLCNNCRVWSGELLRNNEQKFWELQMIGVKRKSFIKSYCSTQDQTDTNIHRQRYNSLISNHFNCWKLTLCPPETEIDQGDRANHTTWSAGANLQHELLSNFNWNDCLNSKLTMTYVDLSINSDPSFQIGDPSRDLYPSSQFYCTSLLVYLQSHEK
jgi:hypothetical protein